MPRLNGTGPQGQGPMTGHGMGYCGSGFARGRNFGAGRGMGLGRSAMYGGYHYNTPITSQEEKDILQDEAEYLKQRLSDIQDYLGQKKDKK